MMTEFLRRFYLFLILRRFYFLPWFVALFFIIYLLRDVSDVYFVFLLFFLVGAFAFETRNVFAVLYFRRFFEGFRCRLRPPAVCILYKPKEQPPPEVPLPGGTVYEGLFFTAAIIIDERAWLHELQHIRDAPIFSTLRYTLLAVMFTALHLYIALKTTSEIIMAEITTAMIFSASIASILLKYVGEFRAYRREGVSLPEALERIENAAKVTGGLTRNITFYIVVIALTVYIVSITIDNLPYSAVAVAGGSALVFALVLRRALGVFTRRLFGIDVGDFLFSSFIAGAILHPLLGVFTSFLFSWAMFGKVKDAAVAAAVAALSLFAVLLPGLIWTSVLLL
jgi:hypothetical protein